MTAQKEAWINSFESGKAWLAKIPSLESMKIYISYFKMFSDAVHKNPDELIAYKIEGLQNINTSKEWQTETLLENYLAESKLPKSLKLLSRNCTVSFFKHNRRALEPTTASNIKAELPDSKKRTPTLTDLTELENEAHNARDKALIWFLESTGVRFGSLIQLKWALGHKSGSA